MVEKKKCRLKKSIFQLHIIFLIFLLPSTAFLPIVFAADSSEDLTSTSTSTSDSASFESSETLPTEETIPSTTESTATSSSEKLPESSTSTSEESKKEEPDKKETSTKDEPEVYEYVVTKTTQDFISLIGEDARRIADENDLYASVMIAQAILESSSGNSKLARKPNYNLFGIKGNYRGKSVSMDTMEDDGFGKYFSIMAKFRKYPGYKESLEDYAALLAGRNGDFSSTLYYGARKSYAKTYKEATKFLTGKYATDTHYDKKLNGLIETYDLTRFDFLDPEAQAKYEKERQEAMIRRINQGDTLWDISKESEIDIPVLVKSNRLSDSLMREGQEILIPSKDEADEEEADLDDFSDDLDKVSTTQNVQSVALKVGQRITNSLKKELEKDYTDKK